MVVAILLRGEESGVISQGVKLEHEREQGKGRPLGGSAVSPYL